MSSSLRKRYFDGHDVVVVQLGSDKAKNKRPGTVSERGPARQIPANSDPQSNDRQLNMLDLMGLAALNRA